MESKITTILSIVISIIIFIRCIFDNYEKLVYLVAAINIVGIIFVIFTILEKIENNISQKIENSKVPSPIIDREIKKNKIKIWGISVVVCLILIVIYLSCWCSNLGNDIISIISLGIAILDDELVNEITNLYKI